MLVVDQVREKVGAHHHGAEPSHYFSYCPILNPLPYLLIKIVGLLANLLSGEMGRVGG